MEYTELRTKNNESYDTTLPFPVDTTEAQETVSVSPTLTYTGKAAAGGISMSSTAFKPIIGALGSRVGSYWGESKNLVYSAFADGNNKKASNILTSVTETAASAALTIYDPNQNLEVMFESVTGTVKRFIAKVYDKNGGTLYGWIRGISVSSNVYTFEIFNARKVESGQSWVGTLGNFDNTQLEKVEIYHYNSSVAFDSVVINSGTTFLEEVGCPKEYSNDLAAQLKYAETLSNGQFFIDYQRGNFIGKRADALVSSEAITYNIWSSTSGGSSGSPSSNVAVTSIVPGTGATNLGKAEDSAHSSGDVGVMDLGVSNEGQAQLSSTDGEYTPKAVSTRGNTYVEGNKDHGSTDSGYPVKVGGKYNSTPPTLSANQRGDLQLDVSANLKIAEQFTAQAEDNTLGVVYTLEKPIASSTSAVTLDTSSAAEASSVAKASAGRLYGFVFSNGNGATRYLQFFNSTTVPADTTVPFLVFRVATGETLHWEFNKGIPFSNGISWCNSSTQNTKTIGSADSLANVFCA